MTDIQIAKIVAYSAMTIIIAVFSWFIIWLTIDHFKNFDEDIKRRKELLDAFVKYYSRGSYDGEDH